MTYLLIYFALLNLADGWTTWQILRFGGREINPAIAWLMLKIGRYPTLLVVKIIPVIVIWWFALHGMPYTILGLICLGYTAVVVWNLYQWREAR